MNQSSSRQTEQQPDFSIEKYGERATEKEECEEQLLAEYASLLAFFVVSVAAVTGIAIEQGRLPRRFGLLDLALLGIATHKLSRIVAKDRITSILRAPFVCYVGSAGAGEVDEEPRGHGIPARHRPLGLLSVLHGPVVRDNAGIRPCFCTARLTFSRSDFR